MTKPSKQDYKHLHPFFLNLPIENIKKMLEATTQWVVRKLMDSTLYMHFKAQFPALNVPCHPEAIATNTVYANVPIINGGCQSAQIFVGCLTYVMDPYGMMSNKQFVNTLLEVIHHWGVMNKLISNNSKVEISNCVINML